MRKPIDMSNTNIDSLDQKILAMIADNARVPFLEVARACHVSGAAVHQRIQRLTQLGVIKGSQFIFDPETLGYETCAFVGLYLKDPSQFDRVVEALREIPEVVATNENVNASGGRVYVDLGKSTKRKRSAAEIAAVIM